MVSPEGGSINTPTMITPPVEGIRTEPDPLRARFSGSVVTSTGDPMATGVGVPMARPSHITTVSVVPIVTPSTVADPDTVT